MEKIKNKTCSEINCPELTCHKPLSAKDLKVLCSFRVMPTIQELLSDAEYTEYEKTSLDEVVSNDSNFVKCPNPKCNNVMEKLKNIGTKPSVPKPAAAAVAMETVL